MYNQLLIVSVILFIISCILLAIFIVKLQNKYLDLKEQKNEQIKLENKISALNSEFHALYEVFAQKKSEQDLEFNNYCNELNNRRKDILQNYEQMIHNSEIESEEAIQNIKLEYEFKKDKIQEDYDNEIKKLDKIKKTLSAANEAILRQQEIENKIAFYSLQLDEKDLYEIKILKNIETQFSNPRPVRMLIWTTYYSKKANDLCARVLKSANRMGIYKITHIDSKQVYIGQAKNIKERWREHMKCGLGIDTPAGNKLYKAMQKYGLESFTFEILEECKNDELNEKEKFYIDLYDSYNLGFNSTKGNSK